MEMRNGRMQIKAISRLRQVWCWISRKMLHALPPAKSYMSAHQQTKNFLFTLFISLLGNFYFTKFVAPCLLFDFVVTNTVLMRCVLLKVKY